MKSTTLFIVHLLLPFIIFGQTASTRDSVVIPERWFRAATVELQRYDDLKIEADILRKSVNNLQSLNEKLTDFNNTLQERNTELDGRVKDQLKLSDLITRQCVKDKDLLTGQIRKANRRALFKTIGGTLTGAAVGIIVGLIIIR